MKTQLAALFAVLAIGQVAHAQSVPAVLLAGAGFFNSGGVRQHAAVTTQVQTQFRSTASQKSTFQEQQQEHQQEHQQEQQQESQVLSSSSEHLLEGVFEPLGLPSGATLILGNIDTSFSCGDYPYGFYADEYNFCRVFHVCVPFLYDDGHIEPTQYSFMCSGESVFDQSQLACVERDVATAPCEESSFHYSSNEAFGLPHEKA